MFIILIKLHNNSNNYKGRNQSLKRCVFFLFFSRGISFSISFRYTFYVLKFSPSVKLRVSQLYFATLVSSKSFRNNSYNCRKINLLILHHKTRN